MSGVTLRDHLGFELNIEPNEASAFAKYFASLPSLLTADRDLAKVAPLTLTDPALTAIQMKLQLQQPISVGLEAATLTLKGGLTGSLAIFLPDPDLAPGQIDTLFSADEYGEDVPIAPTERYVSVGFTGTTGPSVAGSVSHLQFGFDAEADLSLTNYRKFSITPAPPTVSEAIGETVARFAIPASPEDWEAMPLDSIAVLASSGSLQFSAATSLSVVPNALAIPDLPVLSAASLSAGAAITVGGSYRLSGKYQMRAHKTGPHTVLFGYYKERGSDWEASMTANAGAEISFTNDDLFSQIISALSPNAQADLKELKAAQVDAGLISAIQKTVATGVQRNLELALTFELGHLHASGAAFLYEADLTALNSPGREAIAQALRGDLTAISAGGSTQLAGIKIVHSLFTNLRQRKHTLKVNLLGIYNFISVSKLALQGKVLYSPETGELILTDTATASRIQASFTNLPGKAQAAHPQQLQKLLASSFLLTASYRASGLTTSPPDFRLVQSYYKTHQETNRKTMLSDLSVAIGLGLLTPHEADTLLKDVESSGRTLLYADSAYDDTLTTSLFLQNGKPRSRSEYEGAGREAMQIVIADGGADQSRLQPLQDDELWRRMTQIGQSGFSDLFPALSGSQRSAIAADYSTIIWWAQTMYETAQKLEEIRSYLTLGAAAEPDRFQKLRSRFATHMKRVAASTKEEFGRPWGLVAMNLLTGNRSEAQVVFTGSLVSWTKERKLSA